MDQPELSNSRDSLGEMNCLEEEELHVASPDPAEYKVEEELQAHQGSQSAADSKPPVPSLDAAGEPQLNISSPPVHLHHFKCQKQRFRRELQER